MAKKLRLNVVCSSRDKRFLVLAERDWTLEMFRECSEDVFQRLYPHEPQLRISGLQNQFHFDMPLNYKVEDTLVDAGLVFVVEQELGLLKSTRVSSETCKEPSQNMKSADQRKKVPPKKKKRKSLRSFKSQTCHSEKNAVCSSSNRVTSTTSPTPAKEETNLTPQIVEKISEDSEVDIETIDDAPMHSLEDVHSCSGVQRKRVNTKMRTQRNNARLLVLKKARKIKKKTQTMPHT